MLKVLAEEKKPSCRRSVVPRAGFEPATNGDITRNSPFLFGVHIPWRKGNFGRVAWESTSLEKKKKYYRLGL